MKVGKTYVTKSGKKLTVARHLRGTTHSAILVDDRKKAYAYTNDGFVVDEHHPHKDDIDFTKKV